MIGRTNVGGSSAFAVIDVTYPEGASCSCTNGVRTFQAENSSGYWMFVIPRAGEWTVTVANSSTSKSETVEVTENRSYSLSFSFMMTLYENGSASAITGGFSATSGSVLKVSANAPAYNNAVENGNSNSKIDFTGYKTLHFDNVSYSTSDSDRSYAVLGLGTSTGGSYTDGFSARVSISSNVSGKSYTVDISNVNGLYYIKYRVQAWANTNGTSCNVTIGKVWVE